MVDLSPVPGAPALRLAGERRRSEVLLVVADVHLGLGATPAQPIGVPGGSAVDLAFALDRWARRAGADRYVVAGDAKHPIVGVPPALRPVVFDFFSHLLSTGRGVDLVPGNHDPGLARHLPREVEVRPVGGIVREGVGIFHGHRWPSRPVLDAERWVVGHLHPGVRFAPTPGHPGGKQRCWVRVDFSSSGAPPARRRRDRGLRASELVVLPAANPIAGVEALNREAPRRGRTFLVRRFLAYGSARAYLLDGTDVGALAIPREEPPASRPRAPRPN